MILPPIDTTGADILELPMKKREPLDGQTFLQPVPFSQCKHFRGPFVVDVDGGKCTCKECGGEVAPIFVLEKLMKEESRWMRNREAHLNEVRRLEERSRTKCQHCGEMTRISSK